MCLKKFCSPTLELQLHLSPMLWDKRSKLPPVLLSVRCCGESSGIAATAPGAVASQQSGSTPTESSQPPSVFMALILSIMERSTCLPNTRRPFPLHTGGGTARTIYFPQVVSPARLATSGLWQRGRLAMTHPHRPSRASERSRHF